MNVVLLNHTPDPERAIATAARLCYAPVGAAELQETMTDEQMLGVLKVILAGGHYSALEHATFTFAIEGVSRSLTHQLVRHRMASYNQQSQRYVTFGNHNEQFICPESIQNDPYLKNKWDNVIQTIEEFYDHMVSEGIPKEDARYILPNATETKIVVTMNARELLETFFTLRCCNRAQWEIRELAWEMLKLVKPLAPTIFEQAGPTCVRDKCHEGKMTCGNPYPKVV